MMYQYRNSTQYSEIIMRRFFECVASGRLYKTRLILEDDDSVIDINSQNDNGYTALMVACQLDDNKSNTRVQMMRLLLRYGADPNIPDRQGLSTLAWACKYEKTDVVKLLLNKMLIDLDYNLQDFHGNTPLLHAVRTANVNLVRTLVRVMKKLDVNIDQRNHYDITPYLEAKRLGFENVSCILREEGRASHTIQISPVDFRNLEHSDKSSTETNHYMTPNPTITSLLRKSMSSEIKQEFIKYSTGWKTMTNKLAPAEKKISTADSSVSRSSDRKSSFVELRIPKVLNNTDKNSKECQWRQTKENRKPISSKRGHISSDSNNNRKDPKGKSREMRTKGKYKSKNNSKNSLADERNTSENTTESALVPDANSICNVLENSKNITENITVENGNERSIINICQHSPLTRDIGESNNRNLDQYDLNTSERKLEGKERASNESSHHSYQTNDKLSNNSDEISEKQQLQIKKTPSSSSIELKFKSDDNKLSEETILKPSLTKSPKENNPLLLPSSFLKKGLLTRKPSTRLLYQRRQSQMNFSYSRSARSDNNNAEVKSDMIPAPPEKSRPSSAGSKRNYGSCVTYNDVISLCPDLQAQSRRHSFSDIHWLLAIKAEQQQTAYRLGLSQEEIKSKLNEFIEAKFETVQETTNSPKPTSSAENLTIRPTMRKRNSTISRLTSSMLNSEP